MAVAPVTTDSTLHVDAVEELFPFCGYSQVNRIRRGIGFGATMGSRTDPVIVLRSE